MKLDHYCFHVSILSEDQKKSPKINQRSDADHIQIIGGDADAHHSQIIGGDAVKLLGRIYPSLGFSTSACTTLRKLRAVPFSC